MFCPHEQFRTGIVDVELLKKFNRSVKYSSGNICYIKKVNCYIAQYPILRIAHSAVYFATLADLFNQTPRQHIWEASSYMLQLMCEDGSYTYPPRVYSQILIHSAE